MSYKKWISGAIGWAVAGPIGGLLGYALGSVFDKGESLTSNADKAHQERNSFLVSLLVLSAAVMKADGKVMRSELTYVRSFIKKSFGIDAEQEAALYLKDLLSKDIDIVAVCSQINSYMGYDARMQLFHYLVGIAISDGHMGSKELILLKSIANLLSISSTEAQAILSMYDKGVESAYKILEIDESATEDQIKKAYKQMAIKHHPDKVAMLGPDIQKAAEEKFKKISQAYEIIKKERGFN